MWYFLLYAILSLLACSDNFKDPTFVPISITFLNRFKAARCDSESPCTIAEMLLTADKLMYEQKRKKYEKKTLS
jgi:hypothetical protein